MAIARDCREGEPCPRCGRRVRLDPKTPGCHLGRCVTGIDYDALPDWELPVDLSTERARVKAAREQNRGWPVVHRPVSDPPTRVDTRPLIEL